MESHPHPPKIYGRHKSVNTVGGDFSRDIWKISARDLTTRGSKRGGQQRAIYTPFSIWRLLCLPKKKNSGGANRVAVNACLGFYAVITGSWKKF